MKKSTIIALIFLVCAIDAFLFFRRKQSKPVVQTKPAEVTQQAIKQELIGISGKKIEQVGAQKRPIAVMVENFPEARPQSGLNDADVIYEAPTEGGITRFLALYQSIEAKSIGPIRSARTYFAEFANEWGAVYAHVGGNSDALANIKAGEYKNIADADQFFNDPYFQRVSFRSMPHNVYTSVRKLDALIEKHQFATSTNYQSWIFKNDDPSNAEGASSTASSINIGFYPKEYAVLWKYDFSDNSYFRFLAGKMHKDKDSGEQIKAKNIIVQFVKTHPTKTDTLYSMDMDLDSGGKSIVFLDGKAITSTWKKVDGRTRFYNQDNREISLNRGQIWVEVVPEDLKVDWK